MSNLILTMEKFEKYFQQINTLEEAPIGTYQ